MTLITYALIDGAAEKETLAMLEQLDPPACCLYLEPLDAQLAEVAPYLVQVTAEVQQWLQGRNSDWGYRLLSEANLKTLRQHLRKYLQVQLPQQPKPVFFRFYDPRNIELLCDTLSDWQLHHFLGPIQALITVHGGVEKSLDFAKRRAAFPRDATTRQKMLSLDSRQLEQITLAVEQRYIAKLATQMQAIPGRHPSAQRVHFANELFYYLQSMEITDDRVISGLAYLFVSRGYTCLDDIPTAMKTRLEDYHNPGLLNAELLLIDELGAIPLLTTGEV
ncbi:DUF4123 domain-containing protein [Serratia microhaemolytica]|uniref:DUF4123 domain-containing protein n=1 Tax=Serratia microhaemolytica TaxID=2675110 RepID=UPI000FDD066E|nr:DUF4123 domain-containing protein [Serratia microhaemolytica]